MVGRSTSGASEIDCTCYNTCYNYTIFVLSFSASEKHMISHLGSVRLPRTFAHLLMVVYLLVEKTVFVCGLPCILGLSSSNKQDFLTFKEFVGVFCSVEMSRHNACPSGKLGTWCATMTSRRQARKDHWKLGEESCQN